MTPFTPLMRKVMLPALIVPAVNQCAVASHGLTWSALRNEPRLHPVRRVGDGFRYHDAASHDDASAFRRRQIARVRKHYVRSSFQQVRHQEKQR